MRRPIVAVLTPLLLAVTIAAATQGPASAMPDGTPRQGFWILPSFQADAWDIYAPVGGDYRTSASVFKDPTTGRLDQFNCGPETGSPFQVIRFTTSPDGHTWAPETVALRPTPGGPDAYGVCDPDVVRSGGYYYLAYTGSDRFKHGVFVARTPSLSQPFHKWNGQGWGGLRPPAPIVAASTSPGYGVGQPSLVLQPGSLAIYYELHDGTTWQTRQAGVPLRADNADSWPGQVTGAVTVLVHPGNDSTGVCGGSYDSTDVVYDVQHKYIALTTDSFSFADSSLAAYESSSSGGFTRAAALARQAGANPLVDHAHHVGFVRDATGHVTSGWSNHIVYDYGSGNCPSKLRWHDVGTGTASIGWIDEPLSSAADWDLVTSGWSIRNGKLQAVPTLGDQVNRATLRTSQVSANATIDLDYEQSLWPVSIWTGLSFGQALPVVGHPGNFLRVYTTGNVTLAQGSEDNVVASGTTSASAQLITNHLQVVLSGSTIAVYNGVGHDSLTTRILSYSSPRDLYPAGYLGLESAGNSTFSNLTVRDNVPASYQSQDENVLDWQQSAGDWKVRAPSTISSYTQGHSETVLQGRAAPVGSYSAHLADGTYTATVQLNPGADPTSWGGLNLANGGGQPFLDWTTGGYLVFLRSNGHVGLWKSGAGQVVPDVPTGLDPVTTPVKVRVVKTGANIAVYLDKRALPTVNYTDPGTPFVVGGFGLATQLDAGVFTAVAYAGNNGP